MRKLLSTVSGIVVLLGASSALAASWTADPSAASGSCATTTSFPTIQEAIDCASPGDVIDVQPGTYPDPVVVHTDDLTIRGVGAHPGMHRIHDVGFDLWNIGSNGTSIENVWFDGGSVIGTAPKKVGVFARGRVSIEDCEFYRTEIGVIVQTGGSIRDSFFSNPHWGVKVESLSQKLEVVGNFFGAGHDVAILTDSLASSASTKLWVFGNEFSDIEDAIVVVDAAEGMILGNEMKFGRTGGIGIDITGAHGVVAHNIVDGFPDAGIRMTHTNAVLWNNTVTNSGIGVECVSAIVPGIPRIYNTAVTQNDIGFLQHSGCLLHLEKNAAYDNAITNYDPPGIVGSTNYDGIPFVLGLHYMPASATDFLVDRGKPVPSLSPHLLADFFGVMHSVPPDIGAVEHVEAE